MFDGLIAFGHSIWSFCDPGALGMILLSSLVGVIIGALPGLTATMGVALMTTPTSDDSRIIPSDSGSQKLQIE